MLVYFRILWCKLVIVWLLVPCGKYWHCMQPYITNTCSFKKSGPHLLLLSCTTLTISKQGHTYNSKIFSKASASVNYLLATTLLFDGIILVDLFKQKTFYGSSKIYMVIHVPMYSVMAHNATKFNKYSLCQFIDALESAYTAISQ